MSAPANPHPSLVWACATCTTETPLNMDHPRVRAGAWKPGSVIKAHCATCNAPRKHVVRCHCEQCEPAF